MKKLLILLPILLFPSCEVERIPNFFIMNPPLGLNIIANPDETGFRIEFDAYNKETYFNGFSVYISPVIDNLTNVVQSNQSSEDPRNFNSGAMLIHLNPQNTNHSISLLSMSASTRIVFPNTPNTYITEITNFDADGNVVVQPIPAKSFIAVYAYSIQADVLSLPSNIREFP